MNNLHRELAPISDAAWAQIEKVSCSRATRRDEDRRRIQPDPTLN
jgi:uncharacterized linocin/CFP29 family protein